MVPTLFVGVGDRGARIAAEARSQAVSACPEAGGIIAVLAVLPDNSSLPEGADAVIVCTPPGEAGQPHLPDDHTTTVRNLANRLLNEASLRCADVPQGAPCDVLVVADAEDPLSQALSVVTARAAGRGIEEVVAGRRANVVLHVIVPQGKCGGGATVSGMLEAVASAAERDDPPFDRALLVSGASPSARFTAEELDAQCSMTLAMRAAAPVGDAIRQSEITLAPRGIQRIGSIGLAAAELPVQAIAERIGLEAAPSIVADGINTPCPRTEDVNRATQDVLKQLRLDSEGIAYLRDRMVHYDAGGSRRSVFDDVRIPAIAFETIERKRWHVLLANYAIYFRRERLDVAVNRVNANASQIDRETADRIRGAVDRVVTGGRDPSNALEFLKRLHAVAGGAREALLRGRVGQHTAGDASRSKLNETLQQLGEAAASEPWLPSMLFRGALASLAAALVVMGSLRLRWIGDIPSTGIESLPYWLVAFLVPFVIAAAAAWRRAHRARARTEELRDTCQKAIHAGAVTSINAAVESGLDMITSTAFCLTAKPDELRRINPKYAGPNEWHDVEAFIALLSRDLPEAVRQPTEEPMEGWRLDVQRYAPTPPVFHYADTPSFDAWIGEAETLIVRGLFTTWRSADPGSLARTIEDHAIARNEHVLQLTLDEFHRRWLIQDAHGRNPVLELHNDLHSAATPTVMASRLTADADSALFIAGPGSGDGSFGEALRDVAGVRQSISHHSACRCLMIRTMGGVCPQDLDAWALWTSSVQGVAETGGGDQ